MYLICTTFAIAQTSSIIKVEQINKIHIKVEIMQPPLNVGSGVKK